MLLQEVAPLQGAEPASFRCVLRSIGLDLGTTVPEDVKDWVGEGGKIAARRVEMVVEYVGPKLSQFSAKINEVQDELSETAGDAVSNILPALRGVLEELKDTLDVAR